MSLLTSLSLSSPLVVKPFPSSSSSPPPSSSFSPTNHQKPFYPVNYSLHIQNPLTYIHLHGSSRRRQSTRFSGKAWVVTRPTTIAAAAKPEPLNIMICGAPASGKGTQCEVIKKEYDLVHISAGDLLRAEIAAGTRNGKRAKENMEKGLLVPDEIVVMMVKDRLQQQDAQENGWLLDGYPRSLSQAKALEDLGIRPDLFILLDVSEDSLVERVVGRRLDPVTGKIYHLKYSPPESEEIAARLTQRFDDTEEKVKLRLQTHHQNVEAVLSIYEDLICKIDGNVPKEDVFAEIDRILSSVLEKKSRTDSAAMAADVAS